MGIVPVPWHEDARTCACRGIRFQVCDDCQGVGGEDCAHERWTRAQLGLVDVVPEDEVWRCNTCGCIHRGPVRDAPGRMAQMIEAALGQHQDRPS
jgi:hypothetical protein